MSAFSHLHQLLSGVGFLLIGCSTHLGKPQTAEAKTMTTDFDVLREVRFSPDAWAQDLHADVYIPKGQGPWPGVLLIHGGGWEGGDRDQVEYIAKRLARRGFVAFNSSYRLAPAFRFPDQLKDIQLALLWMQDHAADYRMRPERFGAWGYSAGAHLASLAGTLSPGDALAVAPRPSAVVAGGLPSDLSKFKSGRLVAQLLDTTWQSSPEAYHRASPASYISADDPPHFIYHGGSDQLVPLDHAQDMHKALVEAEVHSELFILRGRGHITAFLTDGPAFKAGAAFLDLNLR